MNATWTTPGASRIFLAAVLTGTFSLLAPSQSSPRPSHEAHAPAMLPHREQCAATNRMLRERLDTLLPKLMRACGVEMWIVANREYNEDPVYKTLVPEPVFAARRTTILVFHDRGAKGGVDRLTVSRYPLGDFYESAWDGGRTGSVDEQWQRLGEIVKERAPARIAINTSNDWAIADGLSSGLIRRLKMALGNDATRIASAERLCVRWLETRSKAELEIYPQLVRLARSAIAEAFSNRVITPGVTTTDDVRWWLRARFDKLGLPVWFHPICDVQRRDPDFDDTPAFLGNSDAVIRRGDVLHCDVGFRYLRLHTDMQEMGYVLRTGEREVPEDMIKALAIGNRWQDLLTTSFALGRSGNEVLAKTIERSRSEGIVGSVYTHPLGFFGHAPGPTIGMWDNQGPTPIRGDWPLHANTCYAIEGNVRVPLAHWGGQTLQIGLEQDAWFDGERVVYLGGRQTQWHVVR
ncbi:MAG: M24 family metallopeptidase [Planctomycetota bacterium]